MSNPTMCLKCFNQYLSFTCTFELKPEAGKTSEYLMHYHTTERRYCGLCTVAVYGNNVNLALKEPCQQCPSYARCLTMSSQRV